MSLTRLGTDKYSKNPVTGQFLATSPPTIKTKLLHRFVDIRVLAALVSVVLSTWAVFLDDVVNNDGILYLQTAELLDRGEWQAAFQLYRWPFYPFLISLVAKFPGLSYEYAAHILNAALSALTVVCFISLVRELGGDKATVLVAAIVILLYPGTNEYRSFIIKDTGYIAFYLLSLLHFFRSLRSPGWGQVFAWAVSILIAALFRIEGFVFVATLPLLFYLDQRAGRGIGVGGFSALVGAAFALVVVSTWWFSGGITIGLLQGLGETTVTAISTKITLLGETLLTKQASDHAPIIFFVSLLVILLAEILGRLTVVHAALVGHALYRGLLFPMMRAKTIWIWLVLLNLMILTMFVFAQQFLTGRFPLALSLTLMLAAPFSLVVLHREWRDSRAKLKANNWLFPAVCVLMLLFALDGIYSPTSKGHLRRAGLWVKQHVQVESEFFSDNAVVAFYSGRYSRQHTPSYSREQTMDFVNTKKWLDYDYVAFRAKSEDDFAFLVKALKREPVAKFENRRGDKVVVFKVR